MDARQSGTRAEPGLCVADCPPEAQSRAAGGASLAQPVSAAGTAPARKRPRGQREPLTSAILASLMGVGAAAPSMAAIAVSHLNELLSWVAAQPRFLDCPLSSGRQSTALHELHHAIVCALAMCRSVGVHDTVLTPVSCRREGVRALTARALVSASGSSELRQAIVNQVLSDELSSLVDLNSVTVHAHRLGLSPDSAHSLLRAVCPSLVELRGSALGRSAARRAAVALREAISRAQCEISVHVDGSGARIGESRPLPPSPPTAEEPTMTRPPLVDPPMAELQPSQAEVTTAQHAAEVLYTLLCKTKLWMTPRGATEVVAVDLAAPPAPGRDQLSVSRPQQTLACPTLPQNDKAIADLQRSPINTEAQLHVRMHSSGVRVVVVATCGGATLPGLDSDNAAPSDEDDPSSSDSSSDEEKDEASAEEDAGAHALALHHLMVRANKRARLISQVHMTERSRDLHTRCKGACTAHNL